MKNILKVAGLVGLVLGVVGLFLELTGLVPLTGSQASPNDTLLVPIGLALAGVVLLVVRWAIPESQPVVPSIGADDGNEHPGQDLFTNNEQFHLQHLARNYSATRSQLQASMWTSLIVLITGAALLVLIVGVPLLTHDTPGDSLDIDVVNVVAVIFIELVSGIGFYIFRRAHDDMKRINEQLFGVAVFQLMQPLEAAMSDKDREKKVAELYQSMGKALVLALNGKPPEADPN